MYRSIIVLGCRQGSVRGCPPASSTHKHDMCHHCWWLSSDDEGIGFKINYKPDHNFKIILTLFLHPNIHITVEWLLRREQASAVTVTCPVTSARTPPLWVRVWVPECLRVRRVVWRSCVAVKMMSIVTGCLSNRKNSNFGETMYS